MNKRQKSLPVIMHHLISNDTSHIAVEPAVFETQCELLANNGWHGIGLHEAEEFLLNGAPLPPKSFLMTFDDGYLDNYAHAWPIMKKYGHKGVVFVVTDRITQAQKDCEAASPEKNRHIRPTAKEVAAGIRNSEELPPIDNLLHEDGQGFLVRRDIFMNWDEARLLEESGVIAIAGHSLRHASVFTGPRYSGFHQPGNTSRTFLQTQPPSLFGMPVFERGPEFLERAFVPSPEMMEAIAAFVPQERSAATEFFRSPDNVSALNALVEKFKDDLGRYETEAEAAARLAGVMQGTQETLQRELGRKSRSFCWPWGVFCEEARRQGRAAGFEVFYTTQMGINRAGNHLAVHRFKVKNRTDAWLLKRLRIYSRPLLGALYLKMRL